MYPVILALLLFVHIIRGEEAPSQPLAEPADARASGLIGLPSLFTVEGKVTAPPDLDSAHDFFANTRVIVNYGEYVGFIRKDGTFSVTNLPAGSYLVEVTNPDYFYEPIRVDVTSKGKIRARKVNYMQANAVSQLNYPLRFKPKSPYKYFQIRETWRVTDFLFNPMVLMMVLPLLLIMVLPKMINTADPETQREMQNIQMPKYDMPELSEMMTTLFKGSAPSSSSSSGRPVASKSIAPRRPPGSSR